MSVWSTDPVQWRIQDFPQGGAPTPKSAIIFQFFAKNCMKMKEFGPPGGGRASLAPPLGSANVVSIGIELFPGGALCEPVKPSRY